MRSTMQSRGSFTGTFSLLMICCAFFIGGCDSVGQPLVDEPPTLEREPDASLIFLGPVECPHSLKCTDSSRVTGALMDADGGVIAPLSVTPVKLEECAPAEKSSCINQIDGLNNASAADQGSCEVEWALSDQTTVAPEQTELSCRKLRIVPANAAAPGSALLRDIHWKQVNVSIQSSQPLTLELEGASLQDTFIQLEGPVLLRIVSSELFDQVRIGGSETDAAPQIEIEQVNGNNFLIGDNTQRFPGTVVVTGSVLQRAQFTSANLQLESVQFAYGLIDVANFEAADVTLLSIALSAQKGRVSGCTLERVQFTEYGSMTLLDTKVQRSYISASGDKPLRVYSGDIGRSAFDGIIESDKSNWFKVLFGVREPTEVTGWDGQFISVNFCANAKTARFSGYVLCSRCEQGLAESDAVCAMASSDKAFYNYCDKLNGPGHCPDPQPVRKRPQ
jgi:hypothetical protein